MNGTRIALGTLAGLELAKQVTHEGRSTRGIAYEEPLDHAQREAAQRGSGGAEARAVLDRVRRQRGA